MKHFIAAATLSALCAAPALAAPSFFSGGLSGFSHAVTEVTPSRVSEDAVSSAVTSALAEAASSSSNSTEEESGTEYVVLFNRTHPEPPEVEHILSRLSLCSNHSDVLYTFNNSQFRGFVATMKSDSITSLNGMVEVDTVEQSVSLTSVSTQTRSSSPWGLQRVSSGDVVSGDAKDGLAYTYSYDNTEFGAGVDIYVVDTGVNVDHIVFGGRASNGWTAYPSNSSRPTTGWVYPDGDYEDGAGHGTHVSGTAAGTTVGIATGANIIAVRVLDADGGGSSSDTVAGINWVIQQHEKRKTEDDFVGSILSMSFGTDSIVDSLSNVIIAATEAGIHASVAAGNKGEDACDYSPSNAGGSNSSVVSVGSVGITDEISSFSNTGACTDIYAPGEDVLSSYIGSNNTIQYLDGTSMATPHVTGVMAYLMVQNSSLAQDPAAMKEYLTSTALTSQVSGTVLDSASKILLNNGITGSVSSKLKRGSTGARNMFNARASNDGLEGFDLAEDAGDNKLQW